MGHVGVMRHQAADITYAVLTWAARIDSNDYARDGESATYVHDPAPPSPVAE